MKSLEPLDAVADTISGPIANQLVGKVKRGGVFASVLAPPGNAADPPDVRIETMEVKPGPATLLRMAESVKAGKFQIPVGQRFALADASKAHLAAEKGASSNP
jgi:NADPH:quinone reductase-like Zn-dependent oxidoreductase